MTSSAAAPCAFLPWDTEFFNFQVGRVKDDRLDAEQAQKVDLWAEHNQIECLYFLARTDDPRTIQIARRHGFAVIDIRITFELKSLKALIRTLPCRESAVIRPVEAEDLPVLQKLARGLHRDTRFFSDPGFPEQRCEDLYATWITLECEGRADRVFVAVSPANQPRGYISCHVDRQRGTGQIGLVGVAAETRGQGLGTSLVSRAVSWFASEGAQAVAVVTQGRNIAAQRLYQRCGFLTSQVQLWHHKWYSAARDRRLAPN